MYVDKNAGVTSMDDVSPACWIPEPGFYTLPADRIRRGRCADLVDQAEADGPHGGPYEYTDWEPY